MTLRDELARSDDRLQARLGQATHALAVLLRLYYELDDLSPEEIKRRMLDAINDGTRTPEDRRSVAVHESGFAAFAFYLRTAYPDYTDEEIGEEWDGMLGEPERRGWVAIESSRMLPERPDDHKEAHRG